MRQVAIRRDRPEPRAHRARTSLRRHVIALSCVGALLSTGCLFAQSPNGSRPAAADKWFRRAEQDFRSADVEEARDSITKALSIAPGDPQIRLLAGRIALARLDYDETLRQLKGVPGSDAAGLRGRALWYKGDLEGAADELEAMLNDPDVHDDWAKSIAKLARQGAGRVPFALSGSMLASVEMPRMAPEGPAFYIVPIELNGESGLAMVSTGYAEVVIDSAGHQEPSWVSMRFGGKLEVHDVPAMTQDLSGLSKEMGAPIRALLGVNLLRHLNATLDYGGRQFVVRSFAPPQPPNATRLSVYYYRGGGMVLRTKFGDDHAASASLLIDTASPFPVALDQGGWKKLGLNAASLKAVPQAPGIREGVIPTLRLGAYPIAQVPGVFGPSIEPIEKLLTVDLDGTIGSGLLAQFRVTLADGGRLMWLEDNATLLQPAKAPPAAPPAPPAAPPAGAAPKNEREAPPPKPPAKGGPVSQDAPKDTPAGAPTAAKKAP